MIYSGLEKKIETVFRYLLVYNFSSYLPLYIINEYPKSGGTWLGQMLAEAIALPFSRNQIPSLRSSIMHGHYLNPRNLNNVVIVWRDGRDIMISWYHHCLLQKVDSKYIKDIQKHRENMPFNDYENIRKNLPTFIEYCSTDKQYGLKFTWQNFVRTWHPLTKQKNKTIIETSYENLHKNTAKELQKIVFDLTGRKLSCDRAELIVKQFSFKQQSGREVGQENKQSFLRKGIIGDWQNYFSREACEVFNHFAGEELVLLGYENNLNWIDNYCLQKQFV